MAIPRGNWQTLPYKYSLECICERSSEVGGQLWCHISVSWSWRLCLSAFTTAFLLHTNPKCSNKCDNHVHKIKLCIPSFHSRFRHPWYICTWKFDAFNIHCVSNPQKFFRNVFSHKFFTNLQCVTKRLRDIRGVGRGGSKGSDDPPFQTRFFKE